MKTTVKKEMRNVISDPKCKGFSLCEIAWEAEERVREINGRNKKGSFRDASKEKRIDG